MIAHGKRKIKDVRQHDDRLGQRVRKAFGAAARVAAPESKDAWKTSYEASPNTRSGADPDDYR